MLHLGALATALLFEAMTSPSEDKMKLANLTTLNFLLLSVNASEVFHIFLSIKKLLSIFITLL